VRRLVVTGTPKTAAPTIISSATAMIRRGGDGRSGDFLQHDSTFRLGRERLSKLFDQPAVCVKDQLVAHTVPVADLVGDGVAYESLDQLATLRRAAEMLAYRQMQTRGD
jgi:hypothetical protein